MRRLTFGLLQTPVSSKQLLQKLSSALKTCSCTVYTPPYNRAVNEEEAKQPIFRYVGKNRKKYKRIHVCGLSVTGALGVLEIPLPHNRLRNHPYFHQSYPYRLIIDNINNIACGYGYSLFSSRHNDSIKVWGCGINTDSQLGFQKSDPKQYRRVDVSKKSYQYLMEPAPIPLPMKDPKNTKVIDIACGRAHTLILTDKNGIFTMGNNAFGQCGRRIIDGELYQHSSKVHLIPHEHFSSPVRKVVCGMDHSLFLTEKGKVYSCGWGADGQTGLGSLEATFEPTLLKGDLDGVAVQQISSFADTTLAVSENGEVFGWGSSEHGQLGCVTEDSQVLVPTKLPFEQNKITQVAAGSTACMFLNEDGQVWVWGYGILGKGPDLDTSLWPSMIPPTLFGYSDLNDQVKVTEIRCGLGNMAAITNIGELFSWGKNRSGCLGIGSFRDQYFPWKVVIGSEVTDVQCGADHTIIFSKNLI